MFRTEPSLHTAASPMPDCIARPSRFHTQVRAQSAFRLERRDSAMPARFRIA